MSKTVDSRVVEMRFDNQQFESNVKTSMSTLEKLKTSLDMSGASKSFKDLEKASDSVSFDTFASGIEALQKRFSTLGIVGMRVIENLTDSMMGLASKTVSFLTNGVVQGGITRAMNLENAHFQLQGLLKDEEAVSAVMQNVNDAVDGTAYSLDAAAKVASQFAASGMTAGDEMYTSLRAIAGVAAMTNSEYSDIGDIFTTVSGQGKVMTYQLNQLASRGLNAAATLADYLGTTEANVREMVTAGKIDFKTFASAMDDAFGEHAKKANETFTGSISNMKAALARIGAEFVSPLVEQNGALVQMFNTLRERINDVKTNIGPLADMFVGAVETMANGLTEYFGQLDLTKHFEAFYNFVEVIKNVFEGIWSVIKPIFEAFSETFLTNAVDGIVSFSESLKNLTEKFKMNDTDAANLKSTFKSLFSVFNSGVQIVKSAAKVFGTIIKALSPIGSAFLSATKKIGDFLSEIAEIIANSETLRSVTSKISELIENGLGTAFEAFSLVLKRFAKRAENAGNTLSAIKDILVNNGIASALSNLWSRIVEAAGKAIQMIGNLGKAIVEQLGNIEFSEIFDVLSGVSLAAIATAIVKFFRNLKGSFEGFSSIKDMFMGIGNSVKGVLDSVKSCLEAWQTDLKAGTLQKIAVAVAILAAAIIAISFIDSEKLAISLGAIGALFGELLGATEIFSKIGKFEGSSGKAVTVMIGMAIAVNILASAMKKISSLDWEELGVGLTGMTVAIGELVAAMRVMNGAKSTSSVKDALTLLAMAEAVNILGGVIVDLASLSWKRLGRGCAGMSIAIGELVAAMRIMNGAKSTSSVKDALTLLAMAEAVNLLGKAITNLSSLSWEQLGKGCAGMTVAIGELTASMRIINDTNGKSSLKDAVVLIAAAGAVNLLGKAITGLSSLSWEQLGKGCAGMTVAIGELVAAISILNASGENSSLKNAVGLIAAAESIVIVAGAIQTFGNMSVEQIAKSLITLAVALAAMVAALNFAQGTLSGAAALLVLVISLRALTPVLTTLGNMSVEQIAKSLRTLASALGILIAAAYIATPVAPVILAIGAAVALLGVGLTAAGVGVLAFATGLAALGTAFAVNGAAIEYAIESLLNIIPTFFKKMGEGIVAMVEAIADSADAIVDAVVKIIVALVDAIVECAPAIAEGAMELIVQVLSALANYAPQVIASLFQFIFAVLQGLITYTPQCVTLLIQLFTGILEGIAANLSELINAALDVAVAFFGGVGEALGEVVGRIVGGFLEGMSGSLPEIGDDLSEFAENLGPFFDIANNIDPAAMEGIKTLAEAIIILTANDFLRGIQSFFGLGKSSLTDFAEELNSFAKELKPFAKNIKSLPGGFGDNCKNLASGITPIIKMAKDIPNEGGLVAKFTGDNSIAMFAAELASAGGDIVTFANAITGIGDGFVTNSQAVANGLTPIIKMAKDIPNEGGLVAKITGDNSIAMFAAELASAGGDIVAFADAITGIDEGFAANAQAVANGLTPIIKMAHDIPNEGGLVAQITGDNSLAMFAEELASAGGDIASFGDNIKNLPENFGARSQEVADAIAAIAEMAHDIPNEGGLVSYITGDNSLSDFAGELANAAPKFKRFQKTMAEAIDNGLSRSVYIIQYLIDFARECPKVDANSLTSFGEQLKSFADTIDDAPYENMRDFGFGLKTLSDYLAECDFTHTPSGDLGALGYDLQALADFADKLEDAKLGKVKSFGEALKTLNAALSECDFTHTPSGDLGTVGYDLQTIADFMIKVNSVNFMRMNSFDDELENLSDALSDADFSGAAELAKYKDSLQVLVDFAVNVGSVDSVSVKDFGYSLKDFATTINRTKADNIEDFGEALKTLDAALSECDFMNTPSGDLGAVGYDLQAIADFMIKVNSVRFTKMDSFNEALPALSTALSDSDFSGAAELAKYKDSLQALVDFAVNVGSVDSVSVKDFGSSLRTFARTINNADTDNFGDFGEALKTLDTALSECDFINTASDESPDLGAVGYDLQTIADFMIKVKSVNFTKMTSFNDALSALSTALSDADFSGAAELAEYKDSLQVLVDFASGLSEIDCGPSVTFAESLVDFAETINDAEFSNIRSFGASLKSLSDYLAECDFVNTPSGDLGNVGYDLQAIAEFGKTLKSVDTDKIEDFGEALNTLSTDLSTVDFSKAGTISTQLNTLASDGIKSFIAAFDNAKKDVKAAGESLATNTVSGIESKKEDVKTSGETIASKGVSGIKSKNTDFYNVGIYVIEGFIKGMNSKMPSVKEKAKEIATTALNSAKAALDINSPSKEFMKLGMSTDEGMVLGIQNGEDDVSNAASNMAQGTINAVEDTLDINSPSVVMSEEGHYIVQGIAEGIEDDMTAEEAAEQKAQNILDAFQTVFDKWELRISVAENEESLWLSAEGLYASEGAKTERSIDTLTKKIESQNEIVKAAQGQYDIMVENFGESSEEAVDAYNTLLEERTELQELNNELLDQNYEYSKSWIENQEKYGLIDNQGLVDAWGRMLTKYGAVTEYRDEILDELLSLDLGDYEATSYLISALQDYQATLDEGSETWKMLSKVIATQQDNYLNSRYENSENWISKMEDYGVYGTADKLAAAYRELAYFTEAGVTSGEKWEELNKTVYDLTKEIYDASIEYEEELADKQEERAEERLELEQEWADEAEAINDQLESDIQELEDAYEDALESRTDALYNAYGLFDEVDELEEVDPETLYTNLQDQIDRMDEWQDTLDELSARGLNDSLIEELQDMGVSSYAQVKALNTMTDSQLQQYADLWAEKHEQATDRATAELEDYRDEIDDQIADLTAQADEDLEELNEKYEAALEEFDKATEDALAEITQTFQEEIGIIKTDVPTQFAEMTEKSMEILNEAGWDEAGQAIVGGLAEGVDSQYGRFVDSIISLGEGGITALKQVLGIASPSKEFAKLGVFVDEGLISGLESQEYRVTDEITRIGESMINALSNVTDVDCEPTIRPVVDLSDMDYGLNQMNGAFSMDRSVELTYSLSNQNGLISQLDDLISGFTSSNTESNDKIADAIEGLKSDFADLLDKVGQLQVVMDTGTLVGAITPQMNRSLGTVAAMNRRGI